MASVQFQVCCLQENEISGKKEALTENLSQKNSVGIKHWFFISLPLLFLMLKKEPIPNLLLFKQNSPFPR
jgi:hypothetical protein